MIRNSRLICVFTALGLLASGLAQAQTSAGTAFTYQGRLKDPDGPVTGQVNFDFSLWNDPNSADPNDQVGLTVPVTADVDHGLFTVVLDFGSDAFDGDARWLNVIVDGNQLWPRQELTPAPYALYALSGGTSLWQAAGSEIYYNDGNVGIGISDPRFTLDVLSSETGRVQVQSGPGYGACLSLLSGGLGFVNLWSPQDSDDLWIYVGGATRMTVTDAGNVGIATADPLDMLHIQAEDISLAADHVCAYERFLIEAEDSMLGLYSSDDGWVGSAIVLGEIDAGGNLSDKWSILRNTPNYYSALQFTYGTNVGPGSNATIMALHPDGDVGIGVPIPQAKLHVAGTAGVDGIMFPDGTLQTSAATGGGNAWSLTGNSGTVPPTNFLGTTDNQAFEIRVNGERAFRLEPDPNAPNLVAGWNGNTVTDGARGATISGGGSADFDGSMSPNLVTDDYCTVAGGAFNTAGNNDGIPSNAPFATIGGGFGNSGSAAIATVAGGTSNQATAYAATVGGGDTNVASGDYSALGGGTHNVASASGAMVPGGSYNSAEGTTSFAAGYHAKARHNGSFVWADYDYTAPDFESTGNNQFLIRASGGVGIGTADPNALSAAMLTVAGTVQSTAGGFKFPDGSVQSTAFTGGGTVGYVPKFTDATTLGDSVLFDTGGKIGIGTTSPDAPLDVRSTFPTPSIVTGGSSDYATAAGQFMTFGHWDPNTSTYETRITIAPDDGRVIVPGRIILSGQGGDDSVVIHGTDGAGNGKIEMWNSLNPQIKTIRIDGDDDENEGRIRLCNSTGTPTIDLDAEHGVGGEGRITTEVLEITGGGDVSEQFDISAPDGPPEPGMVVVIDPAHPGQLKLSTQPYDPKVAGVISGANGIRPGMLMGQRDTVADGQYPVALTGRVWCWCDATYGVIKPGDRLTTSSTAGHAMKVTDQDKAPGTVIGKAMTVLSEGRGLVLVLVQPQ